MNQNVSSYSTIIKKSEPIDYPKAVRKFWTSLYDLEGCFISLQDYRKSILCELIPSQSVFLILQHEILFECYYIWFIVKYKNVTPPIVDKNIQGFPRLTNFI